MKNHKTIILHFVLTFVTSSVPLIYLFGLNEGLIVAGIGSVIGVFLYHFIHLKLTHSKTS